MKRLKEDVILMSVGGTIYGVIEILWRSYTHWTMIITGGICFLVLYRFFNKFKKMSMLKKCCIGSCIITAIEFIVGCIVNIWLKMNVWDYSYIPLNLCGQICALYSVLWGLLCIPIISICTKFGAKN